MKRLDRCLVVWIELPDALETFEVQFVKDDLRDLERQHIQSPASRSLIVRIGWADELRVVASRLLWIPPTPQAPPVPEHFVFVGVDGEAGGFYVAEGITRRHFLFCCR
jgi:hypothetical protein